MKILKQQPVKSYRAKQIDKFLDKHFPLRTPMADNPKATQKQFNEFSVAFYKGNYPYLRFGQAFFAHFNDTVTKGVTDPELFYTTDVRKAVALIHERYM